MRYTVLPKVFIKHEELFFLIFQFSSLHIFLKLPVVEIRLNTCWTKTCTSEEPMAQVGLGALGRTTYITLLLGHFHSVFHLWRLLHDGVVGFPFVLDKLLFVICLKQRIMYMSREVGNRVHSLELWRESQENDSPFRHQTGAVCPFLKSRELNGTHDTNWEHP